MKARLLAVLLLAVAACTSRPPQPEGLRLTRIAFAQLPQWNASDAALQSFQRSCAILAAKPDTASMGGAGYAGTVADWRGACAAANGDARTFFEQNFTPYAVQGGDALFTGYYEPEIRGSRSRQGAFQTPVYGVPSDLVRADLG